MSKAAPVIITASDPLAPPPLPDASAHWALFLDVDGTLVDFADDPLSVRPGTSLLALLHALHHSLGGALALVSGREVKDLDRLFDNPGWAAAGLHGLQVRHADGTRHDVRVDPAHQARMRAAVHELAARFDGVQVEDKQVAIALHCRHDPLQLPALQEAARILLPRLPGYELQPGHRVLEFKPAGMDKGHAITELMRRAPFTGRRPVYLGDDLTDEHAFDAVNRQHGLSVRIGSREPTLAGFTLPDPAAAETWLARVMHALPHGAHTHDPTTRGNPHPES